MRGDYGLCRDGGVGCGMAWCIKPPEKYAAQIGKNRLTTPPAGVIIVPTPPAEVAQLVEHGTENAGVGGSIPPLGTSAGPGAMPSAEPGRMQRAEVAQW